MKNLFRIYFAIVMVLFLGLTEMKGQSSSTEHMMTLDSSMLSFTIKFENIKSDTIHSVLIVDTLSADLDLSSFELGVSSHHYDFFFLKENVLCWYIYNVRIPGISDEDHNHGFVKYHINQVANRSSDNELSNRASIYYNYQTDYSIDVDDIASLQHHEFVGVETKADVRVKLVEIDDEVVIKGKKRFDDEQVYLEVFDDNGTVEFFAKMNRRDGLKLNTSFLKKGNHYLDVYDDHHHEVVTRFTKK